jgi:hypothetical protein
MCRLPSGNRILGCVQRDRRYQLIHAENIEAILEPNEVHALLSKLCIRFGFCLPPTEAEKLATSPPGNVEEFIGAVFAAEGFSVPKSDPLFNQIKRVVEQEFSRPYPALSASTRT